MPKCVTLFMGRLSLCIAEKINCNLSSETGIKLMHVKHIVDITTGQNDG